MIRRPPISPLFPSPPLFRSVFELADVPADLAPHEAAADGLGGLLVRWTDGHESRFHPRSEEHTSELQSRLHLVCRLLLEKKKMTASVAARPPFASNTQPTRT